MQEGPADSHHAQVFARSGTNHGPKYRNAIPPARWIGDSGIMPRVSRQHPPSASEQLKELLGKPWPFPGRPPKHDLETWTVTDDWPRRVPVTDAEVDVFEAWFGDLFDDMFGPCR
jgi:hypothetical protein